MEEENNKKREYEEDICSLQDVIDSEKESADIATAVLGASDATNCSYDKGYVTRQALYGCATCFKETNELNGICLACSYSCHQNHDLYELYTKRNFRCDCGNKKFENSSTKQCKLKQSKDDFNDLNKYNHNFKGLYCTCDRPYPDTITENNTSNDDDEEEEDAMIQCSICEDWLHTKHLLGYSACMNANDNYDEMICHLCMNKNQFLWYYQGYIAVKSDVVESTGDSVDVEKDQGNVEIKFDKEICQLMQLKEKYCSLKLVDDQTCYFLIGWRDAICRCNECLKLYSDNGISFLVNSEDTIKFYEEKGKLEEENKKVDENMLISNELSKLNHVSKIEFLNNLNDFKQELKDFLRDFATNGEVVKRENIEMFFDRLNQRKKQKLEDGNGVSVDYYCK
jgi:E3 ubiquitin-protein ligase UBR7